MSRHAGSHLWHSRFAAIAAITVAALMVAGCTNDNKDRSTDTTTSTSGGTSTTTGAPGTDSGSGAKVVAPDAVGPYRVGRQVVEMTDSARNRTLTVDVWYPAPADAVGEMSRYSFLPTVYFDSQQALDAPPLAPDGPFPLVVYSHGSGGLRYVSTFFTEVLASHGFVVIAPDHTGNTAVDKIAGTEVSREQNAINRVADANFVISDMLRRSSTVDDPFAGSVDPERIGITGHSFGGFTALAAPVGYTNSIGSVPPDPRIKAVVAMAPYSEIIDDDGLAALDVPTLLITGTKDVTTPIEPMTVRPWDHVQGRPLIRVDLLDAGHQSFTDVCTYQKLLPSLPGVPQVLIDTVDELALQACPSEFLDIERAHAVIDQFAISFLEEHLAGARGYGELLSRDGASAVPEVRYQEKK